MLLQYDIYVLKLSGLIGMNLFRKEKKRTVEMSGEEVNALAGMRRVKLACLDACIGLEGEGLTEQEKQCLGNCKARTAQFH